MGIPEFLAWPDDTGVAGGFIVTALMGVPAYIHTHLKISRHHHERLGQAERHHTEAQAQATANHNALKQHVSETAPADLPEMTDAEFGRRLRRWARVDPGGFRSLLARLDRISGGMTTRGPV